jgi:hypothetical protein
MRGYSMRVDAVWSDGASAVAELAETVEIEGRALVTPEALVFRFGSDGRIREVAVYLRQSRGYGPRA